MHNEDMVRKAIIHKIIEKIQTEFNGKCIPAFHIYERIKEIELDASYSLVKFALNVLSKEGKVRKVKLHKSYAIYCVGKEPELTDVIDHKRIEDCISKYQKSFTLMQIAECVLGLRPVAPPVPIYVSILYVLAGMVRKGKIYSFTVLGDFRGRLKVIIQK